MTDPRRFYLHRPDGEREGPFDLTTLMRKQRAGKFAASTPVSTQENATPVPANRHTEVMALFAVRPMDEAGPSLRMGAVRRIRRALKTGWRFVSHRPMILALSSAGVIGCFGISLLLHGVLQWWAALAVGVFLYLALQSVMMVTVLRLYRGQSLDVVFYRQMLLPVLGRLVLAAGVVGVLGAAGIAAFVLPGLLALAFLAFTPFLVSDRKHDAPRAMAESVRLSWHEGMAGFTAIFTLTALNLLSLLIIITLPLTLPLLSVALAEIYDDFTAA